MSEKNQEIKGNPSPIELSPGKTIDPVVAKKLGDTALKGSGAKK